MIRFDKAHAIITALIAAAGLAIAYATYNHNVERDKQQQIADMVLKDSATLPVTTLPNINTKGSDKPAEKQPEKGSENPGGQPQQKVPDTSPADTPKEPPKEEPKPFTFWGYFHAGAQLRPGVLFQVNSCNVGKTLVTCSMEAVSPQYDRTFYFSVDTKIIDHEGDAFNVQFHAFAPLQLDRNAPVPFRLDFPVNKDVVEPITVRINGYGMNAGNIQKAAFVIGPKDQQK